MSTLPRKLAAPPRRGRRRDSGLRRSYIPFAAAPPLDELQGRALVQQHLEWLLANIDWFAGGGKATLHMLNNGLRSDLIALGQLGPSDKAGQLELVETLHKRLDVMSQALSGISMWWNLAMDPAPEDPARQHERRCYMRDQLQKGMKVVGEIERERTERSRRIIAEKFRKQGAGQG